MVTFQERRKHIHVGLPWHPCQKRPDIPTTSQASEGFRLTIRKVKQGEEFQIVGEIVQIEVFDTDVAY